MLAAHSGRQDDNPRGPHQPVFCLTAGVLVLAGVVVGRVTVLVPSTLALTSFALALTRCDWAKRAVEAPTSSTAAVVRITTFRVFIRRQAVSLVGDEGFEPPTYSV
jgi:hypothetical protein